MWPVRIYGMVVGDNFLQYLRKIIQGAGIFDWMDTKKRIGDSSVVSIDRESQVKALGGI